MQGQCSKVVQLHITDIECGTGPHWTSVACNWTTLSILMHSMFMYFFNLSSIHLLNLYRKITLTCLMYDQSRWEPRINAVEYTDIIPVWSTAFVSFRLSNLHTNVFKGLVSCIHTHCDEKELVTCTLPVNRYLDNFKYILGSCRRDTFCSLHSTRSWLRISLLMTSLSSVTRAEFGGMACNNVQTLCNRNEKQRLSADPGLLHDTSIPTACE